MASDIHATMAQSYKKITSLEIDTITLDYVSAFVISLIFFFKLENVGDCGFILY